MRPALVLFGLTLIATGACTPGSAPPLTPEFDGTTSDETAGEQPEAGQLSGGLTVLDRSGSVESRLDVWITFTGKDWERVWTPAGLEQATDTVIAVLGKYEANPETYFATLPARATQRLPWRTRIKLEISLHRMAGDNDIHFSEWWLNKSRWNPVGPRG
jgi:hypothetical protein